MKIAGALEFLVHGGKPQICHLVVFAQVFEYQSADLVRTDLRPCLASGRIDPGDYPGDLGLRDGSVRKCDLRPRRTFSASYGWRRPSRLRTISVTDALSYVVKRWRQVEHSRLLRIAEPASEGLLSTTLVSSESHRGHRMRHHRILDVVVCDSDESRDQRGNAPVRRRSL